MRPASRTVILALALLPFSACDKDSASSAPDDATSQGASKAEVVRNVDAKPGDTTTCPFSGRTFVVKADHPRVEYGGSTYWVCSDKAAEEVRADPAKYLDGFEG